MVLTSAPDKNQHLKGCGENARKQVQMLPLLLAGWLDGAKFKPKWLAALKQKRSYLARAASDTDTVQAVVRSVASVAWAYRIVFAQSYINDGSAPAAISRAIETMQEHVLDTWNGVKDIDLEKVTNLHSATHMDELQRDFGAPSNLDAARGEGAQSRTKRVAQHTQHRHEALDVLEAENAYKAICLLAMGGTRHFPRGTFSPRLCNVLEKDQTHLIKVLVGSSSGTSSYAGADAGFDLTEDRGLVSCAGPTAGPTGEAKSDGGGARSCAFARLRLPGREGSCADVVVGEFFFVLLADGQEHVAQVELTTVPEDAIVPGAHPSALPRAPVDSAQVVVRRFEPGAAPADACVSIGGLDLPLLVDTQQTHRVPCLSVLRPAHVVPNCPQPCFDCPCGNTTETRSGCRGHCLALVGRHAPTGSFILNPYFR